MLFWIFKQFQSFEQCMKKESQIEGQRLQIGDEQFIQTSLLWKLSLDGLGMSFKV